MANFVELPDLEVTLNIAGSLSDLEADQPTSGSKLASVPTSKLV